MKLRLMFPKHCPWRWRFWYASFPSLFVHSLPIIYPVTLSIHPLTDLLPPLSSLTGEFDDIQQNREWYHDTSQTRYQCQAIHQQCRRFFCCRSQRERYIFFIYVIITSKYHYPLNMNKTLSSLHPSRSLTHIFNPCFFF